MLNSSRLFNFLDENRTFSLHFFEGQKLIHDLVLLHTYSGEGFNFYRQVLMSFMPLVNFLKHGESLGIYIDSEKPYFRLKVETNYAGNTRTLLLPEDFHVFPDKITATVRLTKLFTGEKAPYTSMFNFKDATADEIVNEILEKSYQIHSKVIISEDSDQSILINKLPKFNVDSAVEENSEGLDEFIKHHKSSFDSIFKKGLNDVEAVVKEIEKLGFIYLASKQVEFFCPCSREKMIFNLMGLSNMNPQEIFHDSDTVELVCDYCKKKYIIHRSDLQLI